MTNSLRFNFAVSLFAVSPLLAVPAHAQTDPDEIVVTARKRQENLNEVPLAISTYSEEDFQKRNINDLVDVASFTPGLAYESYSGGITPAPVIRGLSQTALQGRIQNVGIFLDGVYIQQQGNVDFGLLGIERIEVVKGPQSALYGRNSFAGAINYVSRKPAEEFEAAISLTRGTDSREDYKVGVSGPIVPGLLYAGINVGATEFDGTYKNHFQATNAVTGQVFKDQAVSFLRGKGTDGNLGGYDNKAESASILFTPGDNWEINLGVYKMEIRRDDGATGVLEPSANPNAVGQLNCNMRAPAGGGGPPQPPSNTLWCGELDFDTDLMARDPRNIGNYADSRIWTASVNYRITDALSATYLFGRTNLDAYSMGIGSGPTPIQAAGTVSMAEQPVTQLEADSHELRLTWETDRFTILGGVYTTDVDDTNVFTSYNVFTLVSGNTVTPGPGPFAGDGIFEIANEAFEDNIDSIFAAIDFKLMSNLILGVEGRYTREKKSFTDFRNARSDSDTFKYFSPRVSLDWQATDRSLFYASIAQGEKAGGFNGATADPGFETYDEETNITYEIGSKLTLRDGTVQLNTAIYYITWDDLQISFADTVPSTEDPTALEPSFIGNGKGADAYGLEVDMVWALTDNLFANLAYSYTYSEYANGVIDFGLGATCNPDLCNVVEIPVEGTSLVAVGSDISGNNLSRSPEHKGALGLEYRGTIGPGRLVYTARGDVTYQDEMYVEPLNLANVEDRLLVNANFILGDADNRWNISLWAKNLFDEEYISNSIVTGNPRRYITSFGEGRTLGITLNFNL